jgi:hypothetical protein
VVTFAQEGPAALTPSDQRRTMVHAATRFLYGEEAGPTAGARLDRVLVTGGPHLIAICLAAPAGSGPASIVVVINANTDPAKPVVTLPGAVTDVRAALLAPLARPRDVRVAVSAAGSVTTVASASALPYLGYLVLRF